MGVILIMGGIFFWGQHAYWSVVLSKLYAETKDDAIFQRWLGHLFMFVMWTILLGVYPYDGTP